MVAMPAFIALADISIFRYVDKPSRKSMPATRMPSTSALVSTS